MTSAHLLSKLKKLHRIHHHNHNSFGHGYEQLVEHNYHKPSINHHDGYGTGHGQVNVQVHSENNFGKAPHHVEVGYNNDKHVNVGVQSPHQMTTIGGHNSFQSQSSHINKQEESHHSYSSGSDAIVFQDDNKHQNNAYNSFQGSHVTHEDNFQYTNSKYPVNYGYNTKYDSLNLNQNRPTAGEHSKKDFALGINIGK